MGEVLHFKPRKPQLRVVCAETEALAIPANDCPTCRGRGQYLFKDHLGFLASAYCPCGGDDENRLGEDPNYPGVA